MLQPRRDCQILGMEIRILADFPHVRLTPVFYDLNFEDKQAFVSVIYAYYSTQDPEADMVVLYDSKTGKYVGVFAEIYGGLKLD